MAELDLSNPDQDQLFTLQPNQEQLFTLYQAKLPVFCIFDNGEEMLKIDDGKIYVKGKEVTCEKKTVEALIEWMNNGEQRTAALQIENDKLREELGMRKKIENKAW